MIAKTAIFPTDPEADDDRTRRYVAETWRIALAHLRCGEVRLEDLDLGPVPGDASARGAAFGRGAPLPEEPLGEDAIDAVVDESFPASDPPSWTKSHA